MKKLYESSLDEGFMDHLKKLTKLGEMGSKAKAIFTALTSFKDGDATEATMAIIDLMPDSEDSKGFKSKLSKFVEDNGEIISQIRSAADAKKAIQDIGPEKIAKFSESDEGSWLRDFKAFVVKNSEKFEQILQTISSGELEDFEELADFEVPSMVRSKAQQLLSNVAEKAGEQADKISGFLDMVAELPIADAEVQTESRNLFVAMSDSALNESIKILAEKCSNIGNGYIEVEIPLNSYPDEHTSEDGRMLDYGGTKSDSHEGRMTKAKLFRLAQMAQSLHDRMEDGDDLPEWVQDKITTSEDRISSAHDYIDYKLRRINEGATLSEIIFESLRRSAGLNLIALENKEAVEGNKDYIYKPLASNRVKVYPATALEDVFPTYGNTYKQARLDKARQSTDAKLKALPAKYADLKSYQKVVLGMSSDRASSHSGGVKETFIDLLTPFGIFDITADTVVPGAARLTRRFDSSLAEEVPYNPTQDSAVILRTDESDFLLTIGDETFVKGRIYNLLNKTLKRRLKGIDYTQRYYVKLDTLFTESPTAAGGLASQSAVTNALQVYNALTTSQKTGIAQLLQVDGPFVNWSDAFRTLYSSGAAPIFKMPGSDDIPISSTSNWGNLFKKKTDDAGKGEYLAAALFPNLVAIGGAGAVAGVDLYDANSGDKYEVKEPNFRSGTKGRTKPSQVIKSVESAYADLIDGIATIKATIEDEFDVATVTSELPQNAQRAQKVEYIRTKLKYTDAVPDDKRAVIFGYFDAAHSGKDIDGEVISMRERESYLKTAVDVLYGQILDVLTTESDYVLRGELPVSRINILRTTFEVLDIAKHFSALSRSKLKNNPLFKDVIKRNRVDFAKFNANVRDAYLAAINPQDAFAGVTGIMIVTKDGYRIFSQVMLKEMIIDNFDSILTREQQRTSLGASGNITQGLVGMTVKNWEATRARSANRRRKP